MNTIHHTPCMKSPFGGLEIKNIVYAKKAYFSTPSDSQCFENDSKKSLVPILHTTLFLIDTFMPRDN